MYTSYDTCFVCEAPIECCFQLPGLPMADTFSEKTAKKMLYGIDNEFLICKSCCHLQLKNIIDAKILYSSAYSFRTGLSNSAISSAHICFQFIQDNVDQKWNNVLEIGCSDLYFLQLFANKPTFLLGVDPIYKNSENEVPHSNNINVLGGTLEDVANNELLDKMFDLIICRHVVEHINNLELFFRTLLSHSNDKTYFVFEFPMSEPMINGFRFDHIFHQHVNYFSLFSFETLLRRFGLYIVAYSLSDTGWGNGIFIIKRGKARQGKARQGFTKINN